MYVSIKAYSRDSFLEFYNSIGGSKIFKDDKVIFDIIFYNNVQITFYSNLNILFKGELNNKLIELIDIIIDKELYVGSDEVGVGESIGPIVATALKFKTYEDKKSVILNGIKDSKKLNAMQIAEKANFIKKHVDYFTVKLTPYQFNQVYKKLPNTKAINALLQNQLHKKFEDGNFKHVTDQFVNERKYIEYVKESGNELFKGKLLLLTKAEEKYLEVSAAAIISKDIFNSWVLNELKNDGIDYKIKNRLNSWELFLKIKNSEIVVDKNKYLKKWDKNI